MCKGALTPEQQNAIFNFELELIDVSRAEENVPSGSEFERVSKQLFKALGEVLLLAKGGEPEGELSELGKRYKDDAVRLANNEKLDVRYSDRMRTGLRYLGQYLQGRRS
jgi:hypothetical protein